VQPVATTSDLLQLAEGRAEQSRHELLAAAEAAATGADDWLAVADAWAVAGDAVATERCVGMALQQHDAGVQEHGHAATLRAQLAGRDAAVATLTALADRWLGGGEADADWVSLAEAFRAWGDESQVRRCLQLGMERTVEPVALTRLAKAHLQLLGDHDGARRSLDRASAVLAATTDDSWEGRAGFWAVGMEWQELFGETERCAALLDEALVRAPDVHGCTLVAMCWLALGLPERVADAAPKCFAKARRRAATTEDWLHIADVLPRFAALEAEVREAWQQARALAATPGEWRRLAVAMQRGLRERDEEAWVKGRGFAPAELFPARPSPLGWSADAGALFDWLRERITEPALTAIAAEHDRVTRDEILDELIAIWRTGCVALPLGYELRSALSSRWPREGLRVDQVERAFATTLLLFDELHRPHGDGEVFGALVESCAVLGREAMQHLVGTLVVWLERALERDAEEAMFAALALLVTAARIDADDVRLEPLAQRLEEITAKIDLPSEDVENGFVLGRICNRRALRVWRRLVHETWSTASASSLRPRLAAVVQRLLAN
jgi:hypothetical protein